MVLLKTNVDRWNSVSGENVCDSQWRASSRIDSCGSASTDF